MQGPKTHEQQLRMLEKKPDVPDGRQLENPRGQRPDNGHLQARRGVRESEFPVSRRGMNQESSHNKHNHPGRRVDKPQGSNGKAK